MGFLCISVRWLDWALRSVPLNGATVESVGLARVFQPCLDERTGWVHVYGQLCLCGNINVMIGWAEGL